MRAQKTIVKWKLLGIAIFTISSVHPSKTAAEKHVKRLKKRLGIKATMAPLDPPNTMVIAMKNVDPPTMDAVPAEVMEQEEFGLRVVNDPS